MADDRSRQGARPHAARASLSGWRRRALPRPGHNAPAVGALRPANDNDDGARRISPRLAALTLALVALVVMIGVVVIIGLAPAA